MEHFHQLAASIQKMCSPNEEFTLYYSGEKSDFVRFNHAKIRQPGSVEQQNVVLRLISEGKQVRSQCNLTGVLAADVAKIQSLLQRLRDRIQVVPVDPHLLINTNVTSSTQIVKPQSTDAQEMVADIYSDIASRVFGDPKSCAPTLWP